MGYINTISGNTPGLYVESLTFNNGESIGLKKDDIVVFVGPNNVGKSQSLKDIYACITNQKFKTVIKDVSLTLQNSANDEEYIKGYSTITTDPNTSYLYSGLNYRIYGYHLADHKLKKEYTSEISKFFVNELKTDNRLSIVNPPNLLSEGMPSSHPIHDIKSQPQLRVKLSDYFHKVFGSHITPGFDSIKIPLYLGDLIKLEGNYADEQSRQEEYKKRLAKLPMLHEQGDGMRSFTGILLNLLIPNFSCFLIDEPESFLHPPQAKILGQIFNETLTENKQLFIATHSQEFLKGLIETNPNRVKIIRITRKEDLNNVKLLDNEMLKSIWSDSLLRYSNIIDSVFHENTVVCESDSDCRLYSLILDHLKSKAGNPNNTLFIYCGGKQRFPIVGNALKTLGVEFRIIPDLDILNDENLIKTLYKICGGNWDIIKAKYNAVVAGVKTLDKPTLLKDQKDKIEEIFKKYEEEGIRELNKKQLEELRGSIYELRGWSLLKKSGISVLPNGDAQAAFTILNKQLKEEGIHLPLVGELENFIPTVGGHGPCWVEKVINMYPDLEEECYDAIKEFVQNLGL